MRKLATQIAMMAVIAVAGQVYAQEVSCRHFFMNSSAKRICATPGLIRLDQQMSMLARRVEPHLASYKSDQRRFRKSLKSCQGDMSCLTNSYAVRINDLQAVVDALPPPSDKEAADLQNGMAKESERLANQSDARAYWASRLAKQDALTRPVVQNPSERTSVASSSSAILNRIQGVGAVVAPSDIVPNKADQPVDISTTQSVPATAERMQTERAAKITRQSAQPAADGIPSWLVATFWLAIAAWIWHGMRSAFKVCPKCNKWNAGKEIDRDSRSYTDYVTRNFTDTHRDRTGVKTGSTTKQRQAKIRVTETVVKIKCRYCNNTWSRSSRQRTG